MASRCNTVGKPYTTCPVQGREFGGDGKGNGGKGRGVAGLER